MGALRFDGSDYVPPRDDPRLTRQYHRIFALMKDAVWRTLGQIETATGDPEASISAQLRHMRKKRFGSHTLNKRYLGEGLFEYQLVVNEPPAPPKRARWSLYPPAPVVMPRRKRDHA